MLAADRDVRTLGGARCGAPPSGEEVFCKRCVFLVCRSTLTGTFVEFEVGGAIDVGGREFKSPEVAPLSVYRLVSLRIH
jgi:hypothetical protein